MAGYHCDRLDTRVLMGVGACGEVVNGAAFTSVPDALAIDVNGRESKWLADTPVRREASELLSALKGLLRIFADERNEYWNPESAEEVKAARAVVEKIESEGR